MEVAAIPLLNVCTATDPDFVFTAWCVVVYALALGEVTAYARATATLAVGVVNRNISCSCSLGVEKAAVYVYAALLLGKSIQLLLL